MLLLCDSDVFDGDADRAGERGGGAALRTWRLSCLVFDGGDDD